ASAELDEIAEAADVARRDTQALLQSIEVDKNCDVPDALVQDLRTMDWTYHYACRPAAASGDKELRIRQGLARLDLNLAVRTFMDNAGA
ncbi:hypothetical protein, partial [Escherichia coli]|uniref:hypothetical protein n=1 Tax=Escherichia coli TaxID=562 RepID=UPI0013CFDB18